LPVIPGEDPADWEVHRAGIFEDLRPVGTLEEELVHRIALCSWRLRRAAAFETATATSSFAQFEAGSCCTGDRNGNERISLAKMPKELAVAHKGLKQAEKYLAFLEALPELPVKATVSGDVVWRVFENILSILGRQQTLPCPADDTFLAALGVPENERETPYHWNGWTAGMFRKGLAEFAKAAKRKPTTLLARVKYNFQECVSQAQQRFADLLAKRNDLHRRSRIREQQARAQRILPDEHTLERLLRYESHISRQLTTTLHTLERLQAACAGVAVTPPAVLDVTVNAPESLSFVHRDHPE
jgi:hypothetical protein